MNIITLWWGGDVTRLTGSTTHISDLCYVEPWNALVVGGRIGEIIPPLRWLLSGFLGLSVTFKSGISVLLLDGSSVGSFFLGGSSA